MPLSDEVDVADRRGWYAAVRGRGELRKAGVKRIRLIDQAGGVGGTWYWNRYPGVMCDVQSYVYMPMLEELDYVPTTPVRLRRRNPRTPRSHRAEVRPGRRRALPHRRQDDRVGRGQRAWVIRTDRGDEITARYVVMAVGILNLMKLPDIPGMELFEGKSFHYRALGLRVHRRRHPRQLSKLADKVVAVIGTGASAIQCIPALAESAKHLYVFQRTPSAVGVRGNRPTPEDFAEGLRLRVGNASGCTTSTPVLDGLPARPTWSTTAGRIIWPRSGTRGIEPDMSIDEFMLRAEEEDFEIMEEHRARDRRDRHRSRGRRDPEALLPLPLQAALFPRRVPAGLQSAERDPGRLSGRYRAGDRERAVCNGQEYEFDRLVYATGFEAEVTPFPRRAGHEIIGRGGLRSPTSGPPGAPPFTA